MMAFEEYKRFELFNGLLISTQTFEADRINQIKLFPNPAKDFIQIDYHSQTPRSQKYSITMANGKSVQSGKTENGRINLNALSPGIYFLELENTQQRVKFIKL